MASLCDAFGENICVDTGEVKCIYGKELTTSFLNTCTALGFHVDNYNFLAHIDDMKANMLIDIISKLEVIKVNIKNIKKVHIWIGERTKFNGNKSLNIANEIVKIIKKPVKYYKDDNNIIRINKNI